MTTLYRFYDKDDVLLYVGITDHPLHRVANHATQKPWWLYVVRATFEHHPTRSAASAAEGAAIINEGPLFNVQGNPNPQQHEAWRRWEDEQHQRAIAAAHQWQRPSDRL